ncbi:hypothetical protein LQZ18_17310 [Lachnospiraceae bacterium ZAX-1]
MWKKIRHFFYNTTHIMELTMAVFVLIAILIAAASLTEPFYEFLINRFKPKSFLEFLGYVFDILIGIEFLKMLGRPSPDTVLEVLIFLVARHMILEDTSVVENFITIVSIAILFAVKKYLKLPTDKDSDNIFVSEHDVEQLRKARHSEKERRKERQEQAANARLERLKSEKQQVGNDMAQWEKAFSNQSAQAEKESMKEQRSIENQKHSEQS